MSSLAAEKAIGNDFGEPCIEDTAAVWVKIWRGSAESGVRIGDLFPAAFNSILFLQ